MEQFDSQLLSLTKGILGTALTSGDTTVAAVTVEFPIGHVLGIHAESSRNSFRN